MPIAHRKHRNAQINFRLRYVCIENKKSVFLCDFCVICVLWENADIHIVNNRDAPACPARRGYLFSRPHLYCMRYAYIK